MALAALVNDALHEGEQAISADLDMPNCTDRDLVLRFKYGEKEAFEELFKRYKGMIFNLTTRMAGNPSRGEDLAQEVFLRAYRYLDRFRGKSSFKTWLYRVAINHCRSQLGRRALPMVELDDEDRGVEVADDRRGPEALAEAHDLANRVNQALGELPRKYREAVVLRDLQGFTYQEIATVLKVRIGTVRSRIARGRSKLKTFLEGRE